MLYIEFEISRIFFCAIWIVTWIGIYEECCSDFDKSNTQQVMLLCDICENFHSGLKEEIIL